MPVTAAKLRAVVTADTDQATAALKGFSRQVSETRTATNSGVSGIASAFSGLGGSLTGMLAGMGLTVGIGTVVGVMKDAVGAASDLTESYSKMGVVFGALTGDMARWAQDSATKLGMSRQAAYEALGTFGNLFTAMGIGHTQSAQMAQGLVQLATDLASFNNIDPSVALEKLRAGIVGEAEPLRTLGVNLNEAATKAKAAELGFATVGGTLSTQAAVAARYALIMEQSASAQGDFARTADGLANATRTAGAEIENIKTDLGKLVERPWTAVVHVVAQTVGDIEQAALPDAAAQAAKNATNANQALAIAAQELASAELNLADAMDSGDQATIDYRQSQLDLARAHYAEAAAEGIVADVRKRAADGAYAAADAERGYVGAQSASAAAAWAVVQAEEAKAQARREANYYPFMEATGSYYRSSAADMNDPKMRAIIEETNLRVEEQRRANQLIARDYAGQMTSAVRDIAGEYESAMTAAQNASIGLLDLRPGGGKGANAPGANGAFEDIYRLQAFIQSGTWGETAAKYGLDQAGATEIVRKFQQGIWDASVMQVVDKDKLTQQIQQSQMAKTMMDAVAADLAKESGADPKLIKAMLGVGAVAQAGEKGAAGGAGKMDLSSQVAPIVDGVLGAWGDQISKKYDDFKRVGGRGWDGLRDGMLEKARNDDGFRSMVEAWAIAAVSQPPSGGGVGAQQASQGEP